MPLGGINNATINLEAFLSGSGANWKLIVQKTFCLIIRSGKMNSVPQSPVSGFILLWFWKNRRRKNRRKISTAFSVTLVNFANNDIFISFKYQGPLSIYCSPISFCFLLYYSQYIQYMYIWGWKLYKSPMLEMYLYKHFLISEAVSLSCRAGWLFSCWLSFRFSASQWIKLWSRNPFVQGIDTVFIFSANHLSSIPGQRKGASVMSYRS